MQIAGETCSFCQKPISFETDANWCGACRTVFHRDCLAKALNHCPGCRKLYDPPERHFAYSQRCPECAAENRPAQARCSVCEAATRWDTQQDFAEFASHMKATALQYLLRGIAELIMAVFCVLILVVSLFGHAAITPVGACVVGFFLLSFDACVCFSKSRRIDSFK